MKTEKEINKFLEDCKSHFYKDPMAMDDIFIQLIEGPYDPKWWNLDDLEKLLATKGAADIFFSHYESKYFILVDRELRHYLSDRSNSDRWSKVLNCIEAATIKYYGKKWGDFTIPRLVLKPSKFKDLRRVYRLSDFRANMLNRPIMIKGREIGHVRRVAPLSVLVGHKGEWDSVDNDYYPDVPQYKNYKYAITLWNRPPKSIRNKDCYLELDGVCYLLIESLESVKLHEYYVSIKLNQDDYDE